MWCGCGVGEGVGVGVGEGVGRLKVTSTEKQFIREWVKVSIFINLWSQKLILKGFERSHLC